MNEGIHLGQDTLYKVALDTLYSDMNFPDTGATRVVASARTLHVVTMEAVTRQEWLGLAHTLRVVAVVVVARLARCAWWM